jgi:hypothetical protein
MADWAIRAAIRIYDSALSARRLNSAENNDM